MKHKKILSVFLLILAVLCLAVMIYLGRNAFKKDQAEQNITKAEEQKNISEGASQEDQLYGRETPNETVPSETPVPTQAVQPTTAPVSEQLPMDQASVPPETDVLSENSIFIDVNGNSVVAAKGATERISPASMTKILTILVAAEHISDLDGSFTITSEMIDYCYSNGCSAAGFVSGETVPIRDLFYGTILPSGGEAAVALAVCAAGSHEAFVDLMNEKLAELGLSDTAHFTNCVGIYDENHYCTAYDMAMIMKAAVENDWCREVLSTHVYITTATEQNPEGIVLSNWFLRRIEDKDGGTVVCAKTGFVEQSGDCAASYGISAGGNPYICVTVNTYSSWRCIYDHVVMYQLYGK